MRTRNILVLALPLLLVACGKDGAPEVNETRQIRNVVVQLVKPQQLDVKIKLPVMIRPREELVLRAAAPGMIVELPYDEGEVVPASSMPTAQWLEVDEFLAMQPEGAPKPTEELLAFRNLRHLAGVACFARIDSSQLRESFREAQANYDQAVRDLKRAQDYPDTTGAQLDQARTRRNIARAAAGRIQSMIEDTYIMNPIAGMMTDRMRNVGEYANGGEVLAHVAVMDRLIAELEIPEAHRQSIIPGGEMTVVIGALKGPDGKPVQRKARVTRIDTVAHPITHSFTVEMTIPNEDMALPAGIFGTTEVTIYSKSDALVVPLSAVRLSGEKRSLFVLPTSGGDIVSELADVELGQFSMQWVEIRGTKLKPGMRVVTFGAQALADGDEVHWTDEDPYLVSGREAKQ
ncbi:MAG: efflux RND transporter periplasmic adaptor subunit [Planctomycetes bacterium]|nr:efflux RND transporter periplasmic adaptor subunit [Planctomycetota bacterium]